VIHATQIELVVFALLASIQQMVAAHAQYVKVQFQIVHNVLLMLQVMLLVLNAKLALSLLETNALFVLNSLLIVLHAIQQISHVKLV
jgi:hypothetical protein